MPETLAVTLGITRLLNHLFGGAVAAIMQAVGVHSANPAAPINDAFALEVLVAAGLIAFFILVRLTLSVEKPNPAQQLAEMVHEFIGNQAGQVMGGGYERFQAFITCILLFVLFNNLLGLIPGIETPTSRRRCRWALLCSPSSTTTFMVSASTNRLFEAVYRAGLVDFVAVVPDRDHLPSWRASCRSPSVFMPICWPAIWLRWSSFR